MLRHSDGGKRREKSSNRRKHISFCAIAESTMLSDNTTMPFPNEEENGA
jgi:hypothetical protein